jgi:hypothetical protein
MDTSFTNDENPNLYPLPIDGGGWGWGWIKFIFEVIRLAENLKEKNIEIKRIGIYVIVILALIRFLIYPLHASLREKKVLLEEWYENYRIKSQVLERQREGQGIKINVEKSVLFPHLFDKGVSNAYIQSDVLEWLQTLQKKKALL